MGGMAPTAQGLAGGISGQSWGSRYHTPELNPLAYQQIDAILAEADRIRDARPGYRATPEYKARLVKTIELFQEAQHSWRGRALLEEALSTSDFPLLFGDVIDRTMLGRYQEIPAVWPAFAKRGVVPDFRDVRRIAIDGLEGRFYPAFNKPELTSVQEGSLQETGYTVSVDVYEKGISINWRMLINGQLMGAFGDIPDRLARGARRSEDFFATSLFVDATGPHASLYTAGNANIINTTNGGSDDNPPLSISGLQDAFTVLSNQRDADGEPIALDMVTLVIPPALEVVANNIVNATQLWVGGFGQTGQGGTANQGLMVANWMSRRVRVVVDYYIPVIATTNGNTSWFMFADPNVSRPALEVDFLQGYETPAIYRKAPEHERLGGSADPMMGSWETMEIRYKGIHTIGGGRIDPKATVASNGTSS